MLLYFRNKANSELSKTQIRILTTLRFLSFFLIAFLLLSPFIRNLKKLTRDPIIIAAWDNSSSMTALPDSTATKANLTDFRNTLNNTLSADFEVVNYVFGENAETGETLDFSQKKSDYSRLITGINNNHFNQNIGALIIAGDGIYNQGRNPINMLDEVAFPIYTVAYGDTTIVADAQIRTVRMNRTAFSGNQFPVEVDVQFSKLNARPLKLSILHEGTEIESVIITPPNDNYFVTKEFILEAETPGLQHYYAGVETVENEQNTDNNTSEFVVNVLEDKQKILILSDGWHPDIGAIKNTLEQQKSFDVSVFTEEPYPANPEDFNLIILNQLPSAGKSMARIIELANESRLSILYIIGSGTFIPQFNTIEPGAYIIPLAASGEEAQAVMNPSFATFNLSEDFIGMLPQLPPLQVTFAEYELDAGFTPLFYQELKNIETGKPLIATGKNDGQKTGFIFGEGIWRWRLFDYYQNQSHLRYNELINQLVQYLSLRENEDNFIVEFNPVYAETDNIILSAELYNDAFERVSNSEISITLTNEDSETFSFTFDVQGDEYYLNTGRLPVGDYSFEASAMLGDETHRETGSFTVTAVNLEKIVTRANHNLLFQLATLSGGNFYLPDQTNSLLDELENSKQINSVVYYQEMINEILNLRWLFIVLLVLLSVEWFLRKYWGVY